MQKNGPVTVTPNNQNRFRRVFGTPVFLLHVSRETRSGCNTECTLGTAVPASVVNIERTDLIAQPASVCPTDVPGSHIGSDLQPGNLSLFVQRDLHDARTLLGLHAVDLGVSRRLLLGPLVEFPDLLADLLHGRAQIVFRNGLLKLGRALAEELIVLAGVDLIQG